MKVIEAHIRIMRQLSKDCITENITEMNNYMLEKLISKYSLILENGHLTLIYETICLLINLTADERLSYSIEFITKVEDSRFIEILISICNWVKEPIDLSKHKIINATLWLIRHLCCELELKKMFMNRRILSHLPLSLTEKVEQDSDLNMEDASHIIHIVVALVETKSLFADNNEDNKTMYMEDLCEYLTPIILSVRNAFNGDTLNNTKFTNMNQILDDEFEIDIKASMLCLLCNVTDMSEYFIDCIIQQYPKYANALVKHLDHESSVIRMNALKCCGNLLTHANNSV